MRSHAHLLEDPMIEVSSFGTAAGGTPVCAYTLTAANAPVSVRVMDFGATILGITCPDAQGNVADIVLGFDALEGYFDNPACYGATIGPVANRTAGASLDIAGETWHLVANEGPNNLHTDLVHGLHKRVWDAAVDEGANRVTFTCRLAHGELGLPGERTVTATYTLDADGALTLTYRVDTDRPTYANITNHTYFNLAGHAAGSVRDQRIAVHAVRYLPVREDSVSAGEIAPVEGTPFDLAADVALGSGLDADDVQIARGHGYDHCLCVFGFEPGAAPRPALDAVDPASGRTLSICITHPGAHLYTGNWLGDGPALTKDGATYGPQAGFAFEPEYYPDGVHHPAWPQPVCTPDHPYEESIVYRFGIA